MDKISIIVPVYKAEKYINQCVNSILSQSYTNIEVLLIDDGSPDNCPRICDEYAKKDSRVKVIHKSNSGVSTTRNIGLDNASGDYITFLDSDDFVDSYMYEKMMRKVEEYDCDVVLCDCLKEFPDHSELYSHNIRGGYYDYDQLKNEYYPHLLMMENVEYPATISNWLMLIKKDLLTDSKGELIRYPKGIRFSEDLLFGAKIMCEARSFYYMKGQAYYHYIIHQDSFSRIYVDDIWNEYFDLCRLCKKEFADKKYDFERQLQIMVLFFTMKSIADLSHSENIAISVKTKKAKEILNTEDVKSMFRKLKVRSLPLSTRAKILLFCYKHSLAIPFIVRYLER